jgi:hypothetical protein
MGEHPKPYRRSSGRRWWGLVKAGRTPEELASERVRADGAEHHQLGRAGRS